MKPLTALGTVFLCASLVATAYAAPEQKGEASKHRKGLANAKKAMLARQARDKKVRDINKQALAMRQQLQTAKPSAGSGQ